MIIPEPQGVHAAIVSALSIGVVLVVIFLALKNEKKNQAANRDDRH